MERKNWIKLDESYIRKFFIFVEQGKIEDFKIEFKANNSNFKNYQKYSVIKLKENFYCYLFSIDINKNINVIEENTLLFDLVREKIKNAKINLYQNIFSLESYIEVKKNNPEKFPITTVDLF